MTFELNKEDKNLRKNIIDFSESVLNENVVERDKNQSFDKGLWEKCGEHFLQGLVISTDFGGKGLDVHSTMIALDALGYGCRDNGLSFAIGAHLLACVVPIWKYGNEDQKKNLLPNLCNGKLIAANAISEPQSGSDAFNMNTIAVKDGDDFIINGRKTYCSNAPVADSFLVYAMTDETKGMLGGISAFILNRNQHDFKTSNKVDKMGLRSVLMGDVIFENTRVSKQQLLGKEGGGAIIFNKSMIWERIGLSALHLGTLTRIFDDAKQYVKGRKSFGQSLNKYQAISHKLVEIKVELEASKLLVFDAALKLQHNKSADLAASITKLKASEIYKKGALEILQIFGANGYINNSHIERTVRDATASTLYSGSSEIQKNLIAGRIGL